MMLTIAYTVEELNDLDEPIAYFGADNAQQARIQRRIINNYGGKARIMRVVLNAQGQVVDKEEVT